MNTRKFQKTARINRFKAILITIGFHIALIAVLSGGMETSITDYLPDFVKEWMGMEATTEIVEQTPTP